jgi:iron complex transport system permease protein
MPGEGRASGRVLIGALLLLVLALFVVSLGVGAVWISPATVVRALVHDGDPAARIIVNDIRLPRALLAILIGGTLGLSGAALQGLLRNPLAAPDLFGASASAAFAAAAVIAFGAVSAISFLLPVAAIAGALVSVALLLLVAGPRASLLVIILAGLALSSLAGAGTALALNLAPNPFAALEIAFWLLGSLQDRSMVHVLLVLPFMAAGSALLFFDRRAFRALTLGEEAATSLGFSLERVRTRVVLGVALAVGAGVAVAGSIGFIGLVAPHLVRPAVRHDPQRALLPSALAGAALLLAADIAARLIPSSEEVKVGVLTALIGAPFFIVLIFRMRRTVVGLPS